jgi:hypothetical protein
MAALRPISAVAANLPPLESRHRHAGFKPMLARRFKCRTLLFAVEEFRFDDTGQLENARFDWL